MKPRIYLTRALKRLGDVFGHGQIVSIGIILAVGILLGVIALVFLNFAAPSTVTIASGPKGSTFERTAERYKKILERDGVTVKILPSEGSIDNLKKLADSKVKVDVGFVMGGEVKNVDTDNLMSLGSISYQPLMIFYRGEPRQFLSDFKGQRLNIDQEGSGAQYLALTLLKANGIEPGGDTTFVQSASGDLVADLLENRVDAIFVMGDSTSTETMRKLMRTPDVHLFNFRQADGYVRRINYLNKLQLPMGSLDLGKNMPSEDINLLGPTVEIIAREDLHPALSDLLIEAAREVHGRPGLFKKRGEFPSPKEQEFRISPDASRYYTSGKSFLYRTFPFGVAGAIARIIAFIVPIVLLLIPALKLAPAIYRWRMESRIHRWYKALLNLEHEAFGPSADPGRREELLKHLDLIEEKVSHIVVPAAFGDLFYALRGHIQFVRNTLLAHGIGGQPTGQEGESNRNL